MRRSRGGKDRRGRGEEEGRKNEGIPKIVISTRITTIGGLEIPANGFNSIFGASPALLVHVPNVLHGVGIALLGSFLE